MVFKFFVISNARILRLHSIHGSSESHHELRTKNSQVSHLFQLTTIKSQ